MLHKYTVPEYRKNALLKKLDSLNKKAQSLNIRGIEYKVSDPRNIVYHVEYNEIWGTKREYRIDVVDIILDNISFGLKGWSFLAVIEHREAGNIILKTNDDVKIPKKYYTTTNFLCEHCHSNRDRNNTYLVYNKKKGKIYQVGSTCIHNYLGFDASILMKHAEIIRTFTRVSDGDDDWTADKSWGKRAVPMMSLDIFLSITAELISKVGFISSKKAREDMNIPHDHITGYHVWSLWWTGRPDKLTDWEKDIIRNSETAKTEAKKAIEYVKSLEGKRLNEYEMNLLTAVKSEYVTYRTATTIASIIPYYQMKTRKELPKRNGKPLEYVGKVGERIELTLKVLSSTTIGEFYIGRYSVPSVLERLTDKNGNNIVWFNKSGKKLEKGKTYTGKATIMKHQEYKGVKQTIINRWSFVEAK